MDDANNISTGLAILALIGLTVGLVVFFVVVALLQGVLSPLLKILEDVTSAETAPMLKRGVPGTEQLARTRSLANSVPGPAVAYLQKLGLPVNTEADPRTFPEPGRSGSAGWR